MSSKKVPLPKVMEQLARFPLFSALDTPHLRHLAGYCQALEVQRNQLVCQRGQPADGFFAVVEGQVKLVLPSPDGHEKVVEIIDGGRTFGEAVMFLERTYPVNAQAIVASRLYHIRAHVVFEAIEQRPAFARQMLAGMSQRLHQMVHDLESYCLMDARQRVVAYLLGRLKGRDNGGDAAAAVELPVNKALLANRLNLTPETFSRILHDLTDAGLISVHGRRIEVPSLGRLTVSAQR